MPPPITAPSQPPSLDVHGLGPGNQIGGLQVQQRSSGEDENGDPEQTTPHAFLGENELEPAIAEHEHGHEIGGGAEEKIKHAGHERAEGADEVLRRIVRRRDVAERKPVGQIARRVGDERQKKERAQPEQDEPDDFVERVMIFRTCHSRMLQTRNRLSIAKDGRSEKNGDCSGPPSRRRDTPGRIEKTSQICGRPPPGQLVGGTAAVAIHCKFHKFQLHSLTGISSAAS